MSATPPASAPPPPRATLFDRLVQPLVLQRLARLDAGRLELHLPDGRRVAAGPADARLRASVRVRHPRFARRLLLGGRLGLGDAYVDGDFEVDDLEALLEIGARAGAGAAVSALEHLARPWQPTRPRNPRALARRHITAHYDLGNAFFALWLDPSLTYSSALFERDDQPLADAQRAKLERMAALADLRAGQHVLEIGSGWGSFAIHAARTRGCRVTGLTLSPTQKALAEERVRAAGLQDRIAFRLTDWRDVLGTYDRVVSIEMLEATGRDLWPRYFATLDRVLRPGGRAALQVICHPDAGFEDYARFPDWIERRVFPGCLLGNLRAFRRIAARDTRLAVVEAHAIGAHYARTLSLWRARFLARREEARALGLDERFLRTWDWYLALCAAAFRAGTVDDLQLVLARPGEGAPAAGGAA